MSRTPFCVTGPTPTNQDPLCARVYRRLLGFLSAHASLPGRNQVLEYYSTQFHFWSIFDNI